MPFQPRLKADSIPLMRSLIVSHRNTLHNYKSKESLDDGAAHQSKGVSGVFVAPLDERVFPG